LTPISGVVQARGLLNLEFKQEFKQATHAKSLSNAPEYNHTGLITHALISLLFIG
jgi:hypothetical protein